METRRGAVAVPFAVALGASAILLALPFRAPLNPYDEGLALIGGLRVLRGEVPFKDFAAVYPPAQSYVLAALFAGGGISIAIERTLDLAVRLLTVGALYSVSAHLLGNRWRAAALAVAGALVLSSAGFFGYTTFPALLGTFGALWAWLQHQRRGGSVWLIAGGAVVGATSAFSLDLSAVAAVTLAAGVTLTHVVGGRQVRRWLFVRDLLLLALGITAVALPFWFYVCAEAGWREVSGQLWSHILIFRETRALPLPPMLPSLFPWRECGPSLACIDARWGDWARFYLPPVALLALAIHAGIDARRGAESARLIARIVLGLFTAGLYAKALTRYDAIHALPAVLGLLPVLGVLADRVPDGWRRPPALIAGAIGSLVVAGVYLVLPGAALVLIASAFPPTGCYSDRAVASCVPLWGGQDELLAALDARVPASSPLFVGLQRHDRVIGNDISLYFLAERSVPTRYHELDPGVADTDRVQREIITELQRAGTEWLVLVDFPHWEEPNASARSSGVTVLDEFIRSEYRLELRIARYELWAIRANPAPVTRANALATALPTEQAQRDGGVRVQPVPRRSAARP